LVIQVFGGHSDRSNCRKDCHRLASRLDDDDEGEMDHVLVAWLIGDLYLLCLHCMNEDDDATVSSRITSTRDTSQQFTLIEPSLHCLLLLLLFS
jgi:hypothetical protein